MLWHFQLTSISDDDAMQASSLGMLGESLTGGSSTAD
jgi:hypothetical protein